MSSGAVGASIFFFPTVVAVAFFLAFPAAYRGRWLQWLLASPPGLPLPEPGGDLLLGDPPVI